jgi:hypothetical protein
LLAYTLVASRDYGTKVAKVGLTKAVMAINNAAMRVGALSDMDIVLPALASTLAEHPANLDQATWVAIARETVVAFCEQLTYDCISKSVVTKSGIPCARACDRWAFLGAPMPSYEAEDKALGNISLDGHCVVPVMPEVSGVENILMSNYYQRT